MNIMHNKMAKLIMQLRRTMQQKQVKYCKYQLISRRQVPVAMLQQQMFKVTATRFHSATKTFVPLINSAVDNTLLQTRPLVKVSSANRQRTLGCQSTKISKSKR